jgi:hypothetical protein
MCRQRKISINWNQKKNKTHQKENIFGGKIFELMNFGEDECSNCGWYGELNMMWCELACDVGWFRENQHPVKGDPITAMEDLHCVKITPVTERLLKHVWMYEMIFGEVSRLIRCHTSPKRRQIKTHKN